MCKVTEKVQAAYCPGCPIIIKQKFHRKYLNVEPL